MKTKFFIAQLNIHSLNGDESYHFYGTAPSSAIVAAIDHYHEICSSKCENHGLDEPHVFDEGVIKMLFSAIKPDILDGITVERECCNYGVTTTIEVRRGYIHS